MTSSQANAVELLRRGRKGDFSNAAKGADNLD